ncbi:hypothetical protein OJ996_18490 [Luteolibacter sp. GHJ8]|uniref:Uncharacterized protein n=1 Tax=Luteolibacter rhizosphaerae TaxID=2989719 RepID=A0ABT3G6W8_9BACT|nr:hypothetical protein [Luteolibacter rhizosphaerae]MCW1915580.1 hypothetical protein [Luteolibacter rhizosphaerae]
MAATETPAGTQTFEAKIVPGHQVASGRNLDPRFPGGTIRMQIPHFRELGVDLSSYHPGTINVSIAPLRYEVIAPRWTLRAVKWHPTEPVEDFSFFDVEVLVKDEVVGKGLIYHPHPDTKPEHFQRADVLELLLPFIEGLEYGAVLQLRTDKSQILIS